MDMERRGRHTQATEIIQLLNKEEDMMKEAKPFVIDKTLIYKAYLKVKENKGSAGVDSVSIEDYEKDLGNRLYKLWNRMSSGSYMPNAVRLVEIPKPGGGKRPLGIPTVEDRIAQQAAVLFIEPSIEPCFDQDSYGYRPNRSASDAIAKARERWFHRSMCLMARSQPSGTSSSVLLLRSNLLVSHIVWRVAL